MHHHRFLQTFNALMATHNLQIKHCNCDARECETIIEQSVKEFVSESESFHYFHIADNSCTISSQAGDRKYGRGLIHYDENYYVKK